MSLNLGRSPALGSAQSLNKGPLATALGSHHARRSAPLSTRSHGQAAKVAAKSRKLTTEVKAIAEPVPKAQSASRGNDITVKVDNDKDKTCTQITVQADNKPGLLTALTAAFRDLGLEVTRAAVEGDTATISDTFFVTKDGSKVTDSKELDNIKKCLEAILRARAGPGSARPKFSTVSIQQDANKTELLHTLMGAYAAVVGCMPARAATFKQPAPCCMTP
jgi:hypothetical protein